MKWRSMSPEWHIFVWYFSHARKGTFEHDYQNKSQRECKLNMLSRQNEMKMENNSNAKTLNIWNDTQWGQNQMQLKHNINHAIWQNGNQNKTC